MSSGEPTAALGTDVSWLHWPKAVEQLSIWQTDIGYEQFKQ